MSKAGSAWRRLTKAFREGLVVLLAPGRAEKTFSEGLLPHESSSTTRLGLDGFLSLQGSLLTRLLATRKDGTLRA